MRMGDVFYSLDQDEEASGTLMGDGGGQSSADPIEGDEAMPDVGDEAGESKTHAEATYLRPGTAKRAGLELKEDLGDEFTQVVDSLPSEHRDRIHRLLQVEAALGADVIVNLHKAKSLSAADVAYASWASVNALLEEEDKAAAGESKAYLENLRKKVDSIMSSRPLPKSGSTQEVGTAMEESDDEEEDASLKVLAPEELAEARFETAGLSSLAAQARIIEAGKEAGASEVVEIDKPSDQSTVTVQDLGGCVLPGNQERWIATCRIPTGCRASSPNLSTRRPRST